MALAESVVDLVKNRRQRPIFAIAKIGAQRIESVPEHARHRHEDNGAADVKPNSTQFRSNLLKKRQIRPVAMVPLVETEKVEAID